MESKEIIEVEIKSCSCKNRCPDYDEECVFVENHLRCWMGRKETLEDGTVIIVERAKGYCPFIHPEN